MGHPVESELPFRLPLLQHLPDPCVPKKFDEAIAVAKRGLNSILCPSRLTTFWLSTSTMLAAMTRR
jgi:hypothetical protein